MATKVKPSRIQSTWTPQAWDVPVYVDADSFQWWPNGAWDVRWPNSSTDWDIVLFDWTTWKAIQDSWKKLSDYQEKLTTQTAYTSQWTSSKVPQITTNTLWQVTWITEVSINYPSQVDDTAYASSWDWVTWTAPSKNAVYDKISAMDTTISWKQNALATQTAYTSQWDATKVPQITTNSLGQVTGITEVSITHPSQVSDTAYGSWWDWQTTTAPSQNAVYDKINSIDALIPSAATSSNQLSDKDYVNDSINSITAYYITKNAQWDQFATYAQLAAATTFYSGWVVRVPTRNDYCIVLADENHDNATTRYIYQNNQWEYQYTVNETALTQQQLDALNSGITANKVSTYDWYATSKQDALSTQTAYTSKGSATKVPQITTNTLGQVTWITEVTITHPSQVSDTAYASSWDWVTDTAPSKNAVYDKISAMDTTISGKQNALSTQTAYTSQWTASKVPQISTNSLWQVTSISEVNITYPSQVDDTAYASSWDGVTTTAPSKNAVYDKISAMDTTISWKQNTLATQTAYTAKWSATKVPQITTNTLWQVTWITEVTITQPDISWKQDKATSWSAAPSSTPTYVWQQYVDTANDKLYFATGTSSSSDWTEVWSWGWWGWITNDTTGTTSTVTGIWAWTETEYTNLSSKSGTVLYFTF